MGHGGDPGDEMCEGTKRMARRYTKGMEGSTEARNWLGPFQGGHRSDHSVRNSGSRQKNINCGGSGGRDTIVEGRKLHCPGLGEQGSLQEPLAWERERPRQGGSCSPLRFRSAGADVLQPRPIPSPEPLPVALGTHLSISHGAQQDGEEQGHAEHCDLHLPLRCGECWGKLGKVRISTASQK